MLHHLYMQATDGTTSGDTSEATFVVTQRGPNTVNLSVTPVDSSGSEDIIVMGTGDDSAVGGSDVTAAEYAIDATPANGTGVAVDLPNLAGAPVPS